MNTETYTRIFPPRAEFAIKPENIGLYDNGKYLAQPKFNGSYGVLYTFDKGCYQLDNRHKEPMTLIGKLDFTEFALAHPNSIFFGEYMNKYKLNEKGVKWIDQFVIFDLLQQKGDSFVGWTTKERREFLLGTFGNMEMHVTADGTTERKICTHPYCIPTEFEGIHLTQCFYGNFAHHYSELIKIDMIEGLVGKKLDAVLDYPYGQKNNTLWQFKCRKETKNYKF